VMKWRAEDQPRGLRPDAEGAARGPGLPAAGRVRPVDVSMISASARSSSLWSVFEQFSFTERSRRRSSLRRSAYSSAR
jgi:hypothetical protein